MCLRELKGCNKYSPRLISPAVSDYEKKTVVCIKGCLSDGRPLCKHSFEFSFLSVLQLSDTPRQERCHNLLNALNSHKDR